MFNNLLYCNDKVTGMRKDWLQYKISVIRMHKNKFLNDN